MDSRPTHVATRADLRLSGSPYATTYRLRQSGYALAQLSLLDFRPKLLLMSSHERSHELLAAVAKHISTRRKELGLTQEQLAERAGLSTNYVAKIEVAMNAPSLHTLSRLAEALQVDIGALVTLGRTFSHNDRVERVGQIMESLEGQEERLFVSHVERVADLIRSLRDNPKV